MGPHRHVPLAKRPRLIASLGAWLFVASLICLHRSGSGNTKCASTGSEVQQPGGDGGGQAAAAAAATAQTGASSSLTVEQIEALIRRPVGLHGLQQKGGLPANLSFVLGHMTDTDPNIREEGIPANMSPAIFRWFAHAHT